MLSISHALIRLHGAPAALDVPFDPHTGSVRLDGWPRPLADLALAAPVSGTVYGTLLNDRQALTLLGGSLDAPPYKAAPKAPVLYIKPRNTLVGALARVVVPADVATLQVGAALGLVIGRTACRVGRDEALRYLAGYTLVNDLSVPHDSWYRPSVRFKARDGSCAIGPAVVAAARIADPDRLILRVRVDGVLVQEASLATFIRPAAQLLADVTEFMTLAPGDVLLAGVPAGAPLARPGQRVSIEADGLGRLDTFLVAEGQLA